MSKTRWATLLCLLPLLSSLTASAASAKYLYSYSVKFVCGYNPDNQGVSSDGKVGGEPPVKFGNYATDINIINGDPNGISGAEIVKHVVVLVDRGVPIAREPKTTGPKASENIGLRPLDATMDDCNRLAEMYYGAVPTPFPLLIGYLVIGSTTELDVTAVYTAQTCAYWSRSPEKLECLDREGRIQSASLSIDVEQIAARKFFSSDATLTTGATAAKSSKKSK